MQFCVFKTSWGSFGFDARASKLIATYLPGPEREVRRTLGNAWPDAVEAPNLMPGFRKQVCAFFDGKPTQFRADVDLADVPPFRRRVLEACGRVAYGKTASYADLARAAGKPAAARAAGGAMAHNPLPLVIPCHRVLCSDGGLGGFSSRSGVKEKQRLLALESAGSTWRKARRSVDGARGRQRACA